PFLPTRAGLGSDVLRLQPHRFATVTSPYPGPDGTPEDLVAVPALHLDAALLHMNRGDEKGNGQFLGPDLYMDDWMAQAAEHTYLSVERVVPTDELVEEGPFHTLRISRLLVDGVVEAPNGAHFTECPPDYGRDEAFQREYVEAAASDEAWAEFSATYLEVGSEAEYQDAVAARTAARTAEAAGEGTR